MAMYEDSLVVHGPLLLISGQVANLDSGIPECIEEQMDVVLGKLAAILTGKGADVSNIVKMMLFLTDKAYIPVLRERLVAFLNGTKPVMTLLVVAGLADPAYKVEIEAFVAL